jgi:hypothetical protein
MCAHALRDGKFGVGAGVAGSALRPLRPITARTRAISEENLHERLALAGPRDED